MSKEDITEIIKQRKYCVVGGGEAAVYVLDLRVSL